MKTPTSDHIRSCFTDASVRKRLSLDLPALQRAAVLIPIVCSGEPELVFTKRTESVETHKGQISFPGGAVDSDDRDIMHTALREAQEEIGLEHNKVEVLGLLDDLPTPSGFVITPVVGLLAAHPEVKPSMDEVAEVFSVGLEFFANPSNGRSEMRNFRGTMREIWFYEYNGRVIWGATALMIRSLLARIGAL